MAEQTTAQFTSLKALVLYTANAPAVDAAYLLAGCSEEAVRLARRALELCHEHKERGHEAWTLRLLGWLGVSRAQGKQRDQGSSTLRRWAGWPRHDEHAKR